MFAAIAAMLVSHAPDAEIALVDPNGIVIRESGTPWYPNAHNFDDELSIWKRGTHTLIQAQHVVLSITRLEQYIEAANLFDSYRDASVDELAAAAYGFLFLKAQGYRIDGMAEIAKLPRQDAINLANRYNDSLQRGAGWIFVHRLGPTAVGKDPNLTQAFKKHPVLLEGYCLTLGHCDQVAADMKIPGATETEEAVRRLGCLIGIGVYNWACEPILNKLSTKAKKDPRIRYFNSFFLLASERSKDESSTFREILPKLPQNSIWTRHAAKYLKSRDKNDLFFYQFAKVP